MKDLAKQALGIGIGAVGGGITQAIGQGLSSQYDKGQMDYQSKLQMQQNRQLSDLAFKQWNRTNYGAQVEHMRKAGLNVGLMSGGGGQPGQSTTPTQSVSRGEPNNFMGIGLAGASMQSQIEVNKAVADKTKAEADSIRGVEGTVGGGQIGLMKAQISKMLSDTEVNDEQINKLKAEVGKVNADKLLAKAQTVTEETKQKLNKSIQDLNAETIKKIKSDVTLNNYDIATMKEYGFSKSMPEVAKTVKYLAKELGTSEEMLISVVATTIGVSKLADIIKAFSGIKLPEGKLPPIGFK